MSSETENLKRKATLDDLQLNAPKLKALKKEEKRLEKKKKFEERKKLINPEMFPANVGFYVKNGIRYLEPYWSVYSTNAKGRWNGRELSEIFVTEFLSINKFYPEAAIRSGRVFINGVQMTNPRYKIRQNDHLFHLGHRHERPILAEPTIEFLENSEKWLVINKPPSIPVHACGQFQFHSVVNLLKTLYGIENLKVCHRLDRTTSGVLIFAKDVDTDIKFKDLMQRKKLSKEYVCKVNGIFPENDVVCNAPIGILSRTMGIQCVRTDGKNAVSRFKRISFNEAEKTSIICCKIETGRTHQIRVHLKYLGFPIVNDQIYNDKAWGKIDSTKIEGAYEKPLSELQKIIQARHKSSYWFEESENLEYEKHLQTIINNESHEADVIKLDGLNLDSLPKYDALCRGCSAPTIMEPNIEYFQLMLHCWRYKSSEWSFEAPLPEWVPKHIEMPKSSSSPLLSSCSLPTSPKIPG